jgi:hypothetical protein
LLAALVAQFDRDVSPVSRGRTPEIDSHIENSSLQHANKLCLGEWWILEMETAHGSGHVGTRLVILDKIARETVSGEIGSGEGLAEISASVAKSPRLNELYIRN